MHKKRIAKSKKTTTWITNKKKERLGKKYEKQLTAKNIRREHKKEGHRREEQ